jgi:hypothetical protein
VTDWEWRMAMDARLALDDSSVVPGVVVVFVVVRSYVSFSRFDPTVC